MTQLQSFEFAALFPEPMLLVTGEGVVHAANPAAAALLRRGSETLPGSRLSDLVADDPAKVARYLAMCLRTRQMVLGSLTWRPAHGAPVESRCDGALFQCAAAGRPALALLRLRPKTAATTRFVALESRVRDLHREIATRQRAEYELRLSQERLQLALGAARMGTWHWDVSTNALTWDRNLEQLFGLKPGERVTSYEAFLERVHPEDRAFVAARVKQALESRGGLDYEFRIVRGDGRVRWLADQARLFLDAGDRPAYVTGVCMDITERKEVEAQLQEAQQLESVGRLAGGVAHEANNQMTVILGATEFLLRRRDLPEAVRRDLEQVQAAAGRTASVTAQLLAFSRRQVLRMELLDLNAVLTDFEPVLRRTMGEDCTVELRLTDGLGRVRADRRGLEQVLLNIALNARDAMPRGGRLTVETGHLVQGDSAAGDPLQAGPHAVVRLADTGHGMDAETLSRIFEPFFTTKSVGQGTGLGLSTVYGIVKQCGGSVWAESEPGVGTTVTVRLPFADEAPRALPPPPRAAPGGLAREGAGRSVLVVEDDPMVLEIAARTLREAGYHVLQASDGRAALDLLNGHTGDVHCVVADLVMPVMGGQELRQQLAASHPDLPVLLISGYTDDDITRRTLLKSGTPLLQKPFTPEALVRRVSDLVAPLARVR